MDAFVAQIQPIVPFSPQESAFDTLLSEYERVIFHSLITSFGLDFIIDDQHGGDVDTIHNVRRIGHDERMHYKDASNEPAYNDRGGYDTAAYHSDVRFRQVTRDAKQRYNEDGTKLTDVYTGRTDLEPNHASSIPKERRAELDHVVECKAIHDDRGRVLSGLSGVDLANQADNFAWTNKRLNASMGSWARDVSEKYEREHGCPPPSEMVDMEAYIKAHPDLDAQTVSNMRSQYAKSKRAYEKRLAAATYTNSSFIKSTACAAGKLGLKMGLRQAFGLVFSEIWFAVRDRMRLEKDSGESFMHSIGEGIKQGFENAKARYKDIWGKFKNGAIAGVLSSLTTTLCNIFFTTAKSFVKILRQSWASLVEAAKILFFNPDCLSVGEKFRAASKIIATGASVVLGVVVGEMIHDTGVGAIPFVGDIITAFSSSLVTGLMSCSLLYMLDHNSVINDIVAILNKIPSVANFVAYYREQAARLDEYARQIFDINLKEFKRETALYNETLAKIELIDNPIQMNIVLKDIYFNKFKFKSPFGSHENIDSFMADKHAILTFS